MHHFPHLNQLLADGRLGVNLIAAHGLVTATVLASLLVRRLVARGVRLGQGTGPQWLAVAGEEAARRARILLFWLTLCAVALLVAASTAYHLTGRDVRDDLVGWYEHLTLAELIEAGLRGAGLLGVLAGTWLSLRFIRRFTPRLEAWAASRVARIGGETILHRWFTLLYFYLVTALRLASLWAVLRVVGLHRLPNHIVGFLLQLLTIVVVARLLTLAAGIITGALEALGDRYLGKKPFQQYWERVTRLFPFGERCFEAAVYVSAAARCVEHMAFVLAFIGYLVGTDPTEAVLRVYAHGIVRCIGIFFVTRVLIELLQVLLNEAFGLTGDDAPADQKSRTLVPLLCSVSQYVLYFGAGLFMLQTFEINTAPILAGAGILGLAVGLGAQSLVTDVVSGFFILFENQYLVGDYVQIGDAAGTVEVVGIRVTQIRDGQGKLFIIPNGQIKGVVSYSKGYINAVVDVRVPAGSDLESVFRSMTEAGRRLRQAHAHQVLADTQIHGLVELGTSEMTIRAVTKVRPGTHAAMQNEYRRLLKQIFDQAATPANRLPVAA